MSTTAAFLAKLVIPEVNRSLALMNRDPASPTYGCLDRPYWYYRTLTNFASAIWQQPMLAYSALYTTRDDGNPYFGSCDLLSATEAALIAWCRTQHRSGSFDEWYRNEHSYCPTAITGAGAVLALHLLQNDVDLTVREQALEAAKASGVWLSKRYNHSVMNQNLASAVMLGGLAELTKERHWDQLARGLLTRIAGDQSSEGWFPEYGGFDFGYSTLALDFLALARDFGLADLVDPMAERLIDFLLKVTEPGYPLPGRIGSRGTSHVFLAGAITFARHSMAAKQLALRFLRLHSTGLALRPAEVDDRYFCYFYFPAFALAYRAACLGENSLADDHEIRSVAREFINEHSGLTGKMIDGTLIMFNRRLGGAAAILREGADPQYHLGYSLTAKGGRRYSSAGWNPERFPDRNDQAELSAQGMFTKVSDGQPLDRLMIPFQIAVFFLLTSKLAELFQSAVKKTMIAPTSSFPVELQRSIEVAQDSVRIRDRISPAGTNSIKDIDVTSVITMHSPSARQDRGRVALMGKALRSKVTSRLRAGHEVVLLWSFPLAPTEAPSVTLEEPAQ